MRTKEEALGKIAELEKALELKNQEAAEGKKVFTDTVDKYEARLKEAVEEKNKYEAANKLVETLRELLVPKFSSVPNSGTTQSVEASLTKTLTKLTIETAPPTHRKYSDGKLPGRILTIIAEADAGRRWESFQIAEKITKRWGEVTSSVVGAEMKTLSEEGVLGREAQPKHTYYWIPEGVVLEPEVKRA